MLYENDQWASSEISSCINSEEIGNGKSIGRINSKDTNSSLDWQIFETTTKGEENIPEEEVPTEDPENEQEADQEPETDQETEEENPDTEENKGNED